MSAKQRGFTIIELITAVAASGVVILAATAFMLKALSWYGELYSKVELNRHARETYDLLAYGGFASIAGNDSTKNVYGIRGRNKAPPNGLRKNYGLQYTSNKLTLSPDTTPTMSIRCVSPGNPMPDCGGGQKNVQGWIGSDIKLDSGPRSVVGETVEVTIVIMDPFEIQRAQNPSLFSDTYRTVFTLNRNENDP